MELDVYCSYANTPKGMRTLGFAADLAHRLGSKLQVVVEARGPQDPRCERDVQQQERICAHVCARTGLTPSDFITSFQPFGLKRLEMRSQGLVVDASLAGSRRDVSVLAPFSEPALNARGDGPILLPFGDDESALWAAGLGFSLAAALGKQVILYHTTWSENIDSRDPADHMCQKARRVRQILEVRAGEQQVPTNAVIEMAEHIAEGVIACAMRNRASLICTARGLKIGMGSYVDRLLDQSPVPVLVVGR